MNKSAMNRRHFLQAAVAGAAALAVSAGASLAAPPDFDHDPIQTLPLRGNSLHVLSGMGGNITVLNGPHGLLQVDSGVGSRGANVVSADRRLSKDPVKILINTHWHADHVGGNEAVAARGAQIIAHNRTYDRMSSPQFVEFLQSKVPTYPEAARPAVTFADHATVHYGGETLHLIHVAPAHTDSDLFVHFEQSNVIAAGDVFFNGFYPFIDYSSGGWIGGMIAALDQVFEHADSNTRIVPGHGPIGTLADARRSHNMLVDVMARIQPMVKSGKTEAEVVAAKPTREFDSAWGGFLFNGDAFTTLVYRGLVAQRSLWDH